jgi:crotonobetainyl-CoA:carnitine CoA-transferase CaiB-like acyl-CoA transferase
MSITGSPNDPAKVGVAMTDLVTGTLAQGAILTALYGRQAHPQKLGQRVDCKLYMRCLIKWRIEELF